LNFIDAGFPAVPPVVVNYLTLDSGKGY